MYKINRRAFLRRGCGVAAASAGFAGIASAAGGSYPAAPRFRRAAVYVRSGRLGRVGHCEIWTSGGHWRSDTASLYLDAAERALNARLPRVAEPIAGCPAGFKSARYSLPGCCVVRTHSPERVDGRTAMPNGIAFYGTDATLILHDHGWRVEREPTGEIVLEDNAASHTRA